MSPQAGSNPDLRPDPTKLALDRTWLAHERTLMAWVRTAASMISFGFTIYKFFQFEAAGKVVDHGVLSPRMFALVMVSIGLFALLLATIAHHRVARTLAVQMAQAPKSLAEAVAGIVSVFGILVLFATAFRH
jgi:putative membrane protein